MKTKIKSLHDALAYLMQGLYYAETRVVQDVGSCCSNITSQSLKREIDKYRSSSQNKLLKLERIFNYLMKEPVTRKNEVIDKLLKETSHMLASNEASHLRDQLAVGCIQNINAYKVTTYRTAYMFAVELDLDPVADLIQQILEWETANKKFLAELEIELFNSSKKLKAIE